MKCLSCITGELPAGMTACRNQEKCCCCLCCAAGEAIVNMTMMFEFLKKTYPALTQKDFRYFWFGQCISLMGTWIQATAQQWLVYSLTKSAFLLGLLGVAQFGPMLVFSLVAGVYVDRYPKKQLLLISQTLLMVQAIGLALLVWTEWVTYEYVLVFAVLLGLVNTLDQPARQSFISELVDKEYLRNAINLNSAIFNAARMVGPALAAFLMEEYGAGLVFFLNGLSFIPVIISISLISSRYTQRQLLRHRVHQEVWEGLKYVKHRTPLRGSILSLLAVGTFVMNYNVFTPLYAADILQAGIQGYGLIMSSIGVGSLIGAMGVATFAKGRPTQRLLMGSGFCVSVALIILGNVSTPSLAVATCACLGFFHILFITTANSMLQVNTDNEFRGRVMSIYFLAFTGITPIGNMFAGSVMEHLGTDRGIMVCGYISIFLLSLVLINLNNKH